MKNKILDEATAQHSFPQGSSQVQKRVITDADGYWRNIRRAIANRDQSHETEYESMRKLCRETMRFWARMAIKYSTGIVNVGGGAK